MGSNRVFSAVKPPTNPVSIVYITDDGDRFHERDYSRYDSFARCGAGGPKRTARGIYLSTAFRRKLTPCHRCYLVKEVAKAT